MNKKQKAVIDLRLNHGFFCVTVNEYEQLKREVENRFFTGANTLMDRIIAELLLSREYRYNKLKEEISHGSKRN